MLREKTTLVLPDLVFVFVLFLSCFPSFLPALHSKSHFLDTDERRATLPNNNSIDSLILYSLTHVANNRQTKKQMTGHQPPKQSRENVNLLRHNEPLFEIRKIIKKNKIFAKQF